MVNKAFFIIIILIPFLGWAQKTNRVEELMIWKISEELKLSVPEEKELSRFIKLLNEKKMSASERIDLLIHKMSTENDKKIPKVLSDYKEALNAYNKISIEELIQIQKILPKAKVAKYFVIKSDLTKKIRWLLASGERRDRVSVERQKSDKPVLLPDPKIIEE